MKNFRVRRDRLPANLRNLLPTAEFVVQANTRAEAERIIADKLGLSSALMQGAITESITPGSGPNIDVLVGQNPDLPNTIRAAVNINQPTRTSLAEAQRLAGQQAGIAAPAAGSIASQIPITGDEGGGVAITRTRASVGSPAADSFTAAVRQIGETSIRPSVSQNRIWNYVRPNGSTVQVVARSEDEAYDILVGRGDIGPADRPALVNTGAAQPNTPIGFLSDNLSQMSGGNGGGGTGSGASGEGTTSGSGTSGATNQTLPAGTTQADLAEREAVFPEAAFRAFLRSQGVEPGGIGGRVLSNQFGPSLNTFAILNDLATQGLIPQSPGSTFTDFLGSGTLGGQRRANLLRGALANVNALPTDFEVFGEGGTFTDAATSLANAFLQAQGGSPISTRIFSPNVQRLQQRAQDIGFAGQQQNFLDFLRQQVPVR